MHTPVEVTEAAPAVYAAGRATVVVALGGRSAIGLGKAIALRTAADQVVIPTTCVGSEMTDILPPLLVTFGLSIVLQNALLEGFSADSQRISGGTLATASLDLDVLTFGIMPLLTFASAIAVIITLDQIFYRTSLGRAFRATSDDLVTASMMGINPGRIFAQATGIAMVVVTIAAPYLGMRSNFDPTIGPARLIYALEAVIIGGLGSLILMAPSSRCSISNVAAFDRCSGFPDRRHVFDVQLYQFAELRQPNDPGTDRRFVAVDRKLG